MQHAYHLLPGGGLPTTNPIMKSLTENGPEYPASRGSKISGDPACTVVARGSARRLPTCNSSSAVGFQAVDDGKVTGRSQNILRDYVFSFLFVNDIRRAKRIKDKKDCWNTVPCNNGRCKTCPFIDKSTVTIAGATGRRFTGTEQTTCSDKNVVYLISCNRCGFQYVGETKQTLRERFSQHKNSVKKRSLRTLLVKHFSDKEHCVGDMTVKVLKKMDANVDKDRVKAELTAAEDFWIRTLVCAYPFGLNDKIKGYGCATEISAPCLHKGVPYFSAKMDRRRWGHGRKRRTNRVINGSFLSEVRRLGNDLEIKNGLRSIAVFMKRQTLATLKYCNKILEGNAVNLDSKLRFVLTAFLAGYFLDRQVLKLQQPDRYRIKVKFVNKGMEYIGLQNIFRDRSPNKIFGSQIRNDVKKPGIVYEYEPPISRKLCNYTKVLKDLNMVGLKGLDKVSCACDSGTFGYEPVGHVITGDVALIPNEGLRTIFLKGAKYRIPIKIDWNLVDIEAARAVVTYTNYLLRKKFITSAQAQEYSDRFMHIVKSRIVLCKRSKQQDNYIDWDSEYRVPLEELQKKYVICQADKAANNFIFICRFWYIQVLCKEMGVICNSDGVAAMGNLTYRSVSTAAELLFKKHAALCSRFGLSLDKKSEVLPLIFATPKLHKTPFAFRFIAGARCSSVKPLNLLLFRILSHLQRHFRNYCKTISRLTGTSCYWSVKNSIEAVEGIKLFASKHNVGNVVTCDFSTLFTTLPHQVIKACLFQLVDMCYKNAGKRFIAIGYNKEWYANEPGEQNADCYSLEDVKELISTVLDETYVQFAGIIFKQIKGVTMGGNSSSLIADLTLSVMEFNYMAKAKKDGNAEDCWIGRYIDDVGAVNKPTFESNSKQIYGEDLVLKVTNADKNRAAFLDLSIKIDNGVSFAVYNKTEDFNFEVVRYPFADSNMHTNVGLGVFYSQLIRVARICSRGTDFEKRLLDMYHTFLLHGYDREDLLKKFFHFAQRCRGLLFKYDICYRTDIVGIVDRVFNR